MRRLLLLLLLFCGRLQGANDTGVVVVRFPYLQGHHARVFSSATDTQPLLIAALPEQLDSMMPSLWLYGGTNVAAFCCSAITPERYCIHATNTFSQSYWIEKDSLTEFSSWPDWFNSFGQVSTGSDSLHAQPDEHAPVVARACSCNVFDVEKISGDWMKISYSSGCEDYFETDCSKANGCTMWLRWRRGTTIYADVYIAE